MCLCVRRCTVPAKSQVDDGRGVRHEDEQAAAGCSQATLHTGRSDRRAGSAAHHQRRRHAPALREDHDRHRGARHRSVLHYLTLFRSSLPLLS